MENGRKEFVRILCNIYMIMLLAVLPLYTRGSYYKIGDSKYLLFRNVSFLCLGIWLVCAVVSCIGVLIVRVHKMSFSQQAKAVRQRGSRGNGISCSPVDICVFVYGICALLSAMLSPYGPTAWLGYRDWYMGAVSQIMFVGIYFFVSREYTGSASVIYLGEAALFLVTIIAFLQRFGVDPLGLHTPFYITDWEYSNMLSTIGNINWLCGYLSVLLPWPIVGFLYSKKRGKQIACYVISICALALILTQGSDIGVVLAATCMGIGFLYGIRKRDFFRRSILLALGVCVICPATGIMMKYLGTWERIPVDSFVSGILTKPFWWVFAVILLVLYFVQKVIPRKVAGWLNRILLTGGFVLAVIAAAIYLSGLPAGSAWGSGRGGLWQAAWQGFCQMNLRQKLFGVGPDCFAEYIYSNPALEGLIQMQDHWSGAVFANAHNEWLNILVNGGLVGFVAYLTLFICAFRRYRGMMLGVMVLILYGINSVFSFQQVMSTPLLFLVLGMCESKYRIENVKQVKSNAV